MGMLVTADSPAPILPPGTRIIGPEAKWIQHRQIGRNLATRFATTSQQRRAVVIRWRPTEPRQGGEEMLVTADSPAPILPLGTRIIAPEAKWIQHRQIGRNLATRFATTSQQRRAVVIRWPTNAPKRDGWDPMGSKQPHQ